MNRVSSKGTIFFGCFILAFLLMMPGHWAFVVCGDGFVDPGEECDDANSKIGDGCHPDCTLEGVPGYTSNMDCNEGVVCTG
jgi:cysteine-rich repeat protein